MTNKVKARACPSSTSCSACWRTTCTSFPTEGHHRVDPTCKPDEIIKAAGGSVDAIILTHRHSDHVGAAKELRDKTGATVIASAIDAPIISGEKKLPRDDMRFTPCPVDHVVNDGDILKIGDMRGR